MAALRHLPAGALRPLARPRAVSQPGGFVLRAAMWGKLRVTVREGRAELLAREEEVMARLDHPSLLLLLATSDGLDTRSALVVEHLLLGTLHSRLHGRQEAAGAGLQVLLQVTAGLAHLHRRGLVHTQLSSHAVLLAGGGAARLGQLEGAVRAGSSYWPQGRPTWHALLPWAPPELVLGARRARRRGDVYSLGCLIWEVAVGAVPWQGEEVEEVVKSGRRLPLASLPRYLRRLLRVCLLAEERERDVELEEVTEMLEATRREEARARAAASSSELRRVAPSSLQAQVAMYLEAEEESSTEDEMEEEIGWPEPSHPAGHLHPEPSQPYTAAFPPQGHQPCPTGPGHPYPRYHPLPRHHQLSGHHPGHQGPGVLQHHLPGGGRLPNHQLHGDPPRQRPQEEQGGYRGVRQMFETLSVGSMVREEDRAPALARGGGVAGVAREGMTREGMTREGMAREGVAREGMTREGVARKGIARKRMAREEQLASTGGKVKAPGLGVRGGRKALVTLREEVAGVGREGRGPATTREKARVAALGRGGPVLGHPGQYPAVQGAAGQVEAAPGTREQVGEGGEARRSSGGRVREAVQWLERSGHRAPRPSGSSSTLSSPQFVSANMGTSPPRASPRPPQPSPSPSPPFLSPLLASGGKAPTPRGTKAPCPPPLPPNTASSSRPAKFQPSSPLTTLAPRSILSPSAMAGASPRLPSPPCLRRKEGRCTSTPLDHRAAGINFCREAGRQSMFLTAMTHAVEEEVSAATFHTCRKNNVTFNSSVEEISASTVPGTEMETVAEEMETVAEEMETVAEEMETAAGDAEVVETQVICVTFIQLTMMLKTL